MLATEKLIAKVDALMPNQYTKEQKLGWIDELDRKIDIELRKTHCIPGCDPLENPYEDDMYAYWLQAKITFQNAEIGKYNQNITMFNSEYSEFESMVNRKYMPRQPARGNRFHY